MKDRRNLVSFRIRTTKNRKLKKCSIFSKVLGSQNCNFQNLYTLAEGIMTSGRSLQRSEGDVSNPIKYIYS